MRETHLEELGSLPEIPCVFVEAHRGDACVQEKLDDFSIAFAPGARLYFAPMSFETVRDILIYYVALVILLTFHELGHAWMAWKCGDPTAKNQGRVSLNPLVHMDPIGTVVMPLLMLFLSQSGSSIAQFLIGWAKPVPVDPRNLRNPRMDDILISLAGPWMNLLLAGLLLGLARLCITAGMPDIVPVLKTSARLSLMLCFFNLIPIPPLDGSHVLRVLVGMSRETYAKLAAYGFLVVILVLQVPVVRSTLDSVTRNSYKVMAGWFNLF